MKLPFYIPQQSLIIACQTIMARIKETDERLIFDAVNSEYNSFSLPASPNDYDSKHEEINSMLKLVAYPYDGSEVALRLINRLLYELVGKGLSIEPYLASLKFALVHDNDAKIFVDRNCNWMYMSSLNISTFGGEDVPMDLKINLIHPNYGVVVPDYIAQYLHAAQLLFRQRYFHPCLALCSIALEATLKDVMEYKGLWDTTLPNPKYVKDVSIDKRPTIKISGLGNALVIARHDSHHRFLYQTDLFEEFESVLQVVRNNLVHLSEQALKTPIPELNGKFDMPIFTLSHFMKQPLLMGDVLNSITRLSNKMYERLRSGKI